MKAILLYFKSILLVACVLAEGVLPMVLPEQYCEHSLVKESEKEGETNDKKEDLKNSEKIIARHLLSLSKAAASKMRRLHDLQNVLSTQVCLPILTPPPEVVG